MSRIASTVICRPTPSSSMLVVVGCHFDLPITSSTSIQVEPPSEQETARLVQQRVRTHFHNRGKIEMDRFILHYAAHVQEPCPLVYVCVAEPGFDPQAAQNYLDSIRSLVVNESQLLMLIPQAGERELQPHLDQQINALMMAENSAPNQQQQKMDDLRAQVDSVKTVMTQNVQALMERGDRLENIERRTDDLTASATNFKLTAHRVQRKFCLHNAKWTAITVVFTLVLLTIIILIILGACGVFKDKKD